MKNTKHLIWMGCLTVFFGLSTSVKNEVQAQTISCQLISNEDCHRICSWSPLGWLCQVEPGIKFVPKSEK